MRSIEAYSSLGSKIKPGILQIGQSECGTRPHMDADHLYTKTLATSSKAVEKLQIGRSNDLDLAQIVIQSVYL